MCPNALKTAMGYRGVSQSKLCKELIGVSQSNLSNFLKGKFKALSDDKLKLIMEYLQFPYEFLFKDIKDVKFFIKK